jgi:glycosyltransferase involved in cell wall biosynthesis
MSPLLSVIIPCYNNGKYLVEMIDSFRHQTSPDWEMIIVDDGSTDDTPQVVRDYISDLPNVRFLQRERQPKGSVVCRNIGFDHSKGKYVCHLDADDLVSPTFVEHRVEFMELHPDVDYASFPAKTFTDPNDLPSFETDTLTWGVGDERIDLLGRFLMADYPFSVWNNIYGREAISNLPWDENVLIYTDFSFIIPGIIHGLKHSFSGMKEVDYYYRVELSNKVAMTSSFVSQAKCDSTLYLFEKTIKSLIENNQFRKYKKQFLNGLMFVHFKRLLLGSDKKNVKAYIDLCSKYFNTFRFRLMFPICTIQSEQRRIHLLSLALLLLFGDFKPLKESINRRLK